MSIWNFDWIKAIQLKPRYLFGIWVICAIILLVPQTAADKLGITEFRDSFRGWISIITIVAFVFWVVGIWGILYTKIKASKYKRKVLANLYYLSPEETVLLAYCIDRGHKSVSLKFINKAASLLAQKGLISRASGSYDVLNWPFTIPDFVWSYLHKNKESIFCDLSSPEAKRSIDEFERMLGAGWMSV